MNVAVYYPATLIYLSADRDMLLRFAPCALLMGNNVTMICAIIPLLFVHPQLARGKQKDARRRCNFAVAATAPLTLISSNVVAEVIQELRREFQRA